MSASLIPTLAVVAHWLIVGALSLRVIMRQIPIGFAMAWLAVIFALPFAGAGLYLLFGERRLGRGRRARMDAARRDAAEWLARLGPGADTGTPDAAARLDRLALHVAGFPALAGNEIELLEDFQGVFDALVADIDGARRSCHLGFYIWHEGGRADDVIDALARAAQRGVECRVLADGMGSKGFLRGGSAQRLRRAGVTVVTALPTGLLRTLFVRADLRNHRKVAVIDGEVAYTGSQNLVDPRHFKEGAGVGQWVDAVVRVRGPAVGALAGVFAMDWSVETAGAFAAPPAGGAEVAPGPGSAVQVVPSGPGAHPEAIHQLLLTAIYAARRELVLTTPYFVPDQSIITALLSAGQAGVEVTLIVPARNDSLLVRYASVAPFEELMAAGVRIALFTGGLLHTKSVTIDRQVGVFGSVNLDMRSLWLNFEVSLFTYDAGFAGRLRDLQDRYLAQCDMVDAAAWRRRGLSRRFAENTLRLVGPLL